MSRQRAILLRRILFVLELVVSSGAFVGVLNVRQAVALAGQRGAVEPWLAGLAAWVGDLPPVSAMGLQAHNLVMLAMVPVFGLSFSHFRTSDFRASHIRAASRYARAVLVAMGVMVLGSFLFKLDFLARSFVVLLAVTLFVLLMGTRIAVLESLAFLRSKQVDGHRLLVVGAGTHALAVARALRQPDPWNSKVLGHVFVPGETPESGVAPYLGELKDLDALLDRQPVDEVVFAVPQADHDVFAEAFRACEDRGVDILLTLPPAFPSRGTMQIAHIDGLSCPVLSLRRTPTSEVRLAVKRIIDVVGASVGILLTAPLLLAVAIAIRIDSPGPIFFKQERAGRQGRRFVMWKFRSMVVDAEKRRQALLHLNEMSGPVFKIRRDPRITRVGAFIRRTSIDELPQLFNVLLGHMSLVGPRPPLPSEVAQYQPWQRRRLSVKPGLTGLWQVSGRNDVDFDEWMELDLRYIDNWSLWLDVKILFRTLPVVMTRGGAS